MSAIRFIGDIHASFGTYLAILDHAKKLGVNRSVQVGDYGIGFATNPIDLFDNANHRFIRGNHDHPQGCINEPNWIRDGTYHEDDGIMYVGGATSIDKVYRKEGIDWWPQEVFSYREGMEYFETYAEKKPKIMVTHDCPEFLTSNILLSSSNHSRYYDPSIVRQTFQAMFEEHKPKIWIFGHWHIPFDEEIEGTRFICLNINEFIDIDPDEV